MPELLRKEEAVFFRQKRRKKTFVTTLEPGVFERQWPRFKKVFLLLFLQKKKRFLSYFRPAEQ